MNIKVKNQLNVIFFALAMPLCLLIPSNTTAASEINKKLELKPNFTHLLTFDEKIVRYRIGDEAAFNVEILPDIMNSRNEMLIKPLKETKTNFLVWTENHIYNFEVNARQKDGETEFFNFSGDKKPASPKKQVLKPITVGKYKVDLPPKPPEQSFDKSSAMDFEIDLPPKLN